MPFDYQTLVDVSFWLFVIVIARPINTLMNNRPFKYKIDDFAGEKPKDLFEEINYSRNHTNVDVPRTHLFCTREEIKAATDIIQQFQYDFLINYFNKDIKNPKGWLKLHYRYDYFYCYIFKYLCRSYDEHEYSEYKAKNWAYHLAHLKLLYSILIYLSENERFYYICSFWTKDELKGMIDEWIDKIGYSEIIEKEDW